MDTESSGPQGGQEPQPSESPEPPAPAAASAGSAQAMHAGHHAVDPGVVTTALVVYYVLLEDTEHKQSGQESNGRSSQFKSRTRLPLGTPSQTLVTRSMQLGANFAL